MDGLGSTEYSSTSLMGPPDDLFNISTNTSVAIMATGLRFSIPKIIIIALFASIASIATVVGNVMVMISFKIDKQLQTISNYFLFSLAIAGNVEHSPFDLHWFIVLKRKTKIKKFHLLQILPSDWYRCHYSQWQRYWVIGHWDHTFAIHGLR